MAAPTNHFKLGLFVIAAFVAAVLAMVVLGAQHIKRDTVRYYTYFNESVQGLEVGSPVKYRGVTIGFVSAIEVAPDHRHVEVVEELDVVDIERMNLGEPSPTDKKKLHLHVAPDLRAQLGSQGITGVKFISIDFFDPKTNPPPPLGFDVPVTYIPAAQSMMKSLEDTVMKAMEKLPELVDAVVAILGRVDRMVAQLEKDDVTGKTAATLAHADDMLTTMHHTIASIDKRAPETMEGLNNAVTKLNSVLERVDGDNGLVASVRRASEAFGTLGRGASSSTRELDQTLREVREAAESLRMLTDALERDPDMLLKGRAKAKGVK
jgi:phospholipid/cholesterol/gamma-HCH transport system substrate-binding protein